MDLALNNLQSLCAIKPNKPTKQSEGGLKRHIETLTHCGTTIPHKTKSLVSNF